MRWNLGVDALHHPLVQALHVFGCERWVESHQLVQDRAEGPDVTLQIVWFVLPNLRTCVVGSSSLCLEDACLRHLGNVQVSQLDHSLLGEKYVCTLDVSVDDLPIVECLQTLHHLVEDGPYILLLGKLAGLLSIVNLRLQIAIITVLHDNVETLGVLLVEGLVVACHIRVPDGRQNAHFVQGVLLLFGSELQHLHFLEGVGDPVTLAYYLEDI